MQLVDSVRRVHDAALPDPNCPCDESGRIRASPQAARRDAHRGRIAGRASHLPVPYAPLRLPPVRSTFVSFMSALPNSDRPGSSENPPKLHRALKARHLTMIAIGGSIGT
ncbi:hypothetical protein, partial [Burkholderia sp. HMSC10F09]